ncbi:MAG: fumarylacetoacetate hydrolase family protein [Segniliparus sp.]|uniref:fumarylacetoacetate hydrolase family protein n=1 Tax=Segniliparus sp. TaxID=2804064 RepID=UPI003F2DF4C9
MRIVRFRDPAGASSYGLLSDDNTITKIHGLFDTEPTGGDLGGRLDTGQVTLLAPVEPSKVLAVGRNFAAHAAELGNEVPESPLIFIKPSTSVIGPDAEIVYPAYTQSLHHEAELAVVIGSRCRNLTPAEVPDVILGFTCANDITARDLQQPDKQWWRAKGSDTFCPLGPWIVTDLDPSDVRITASVNGQVRQDGTSAQMIRPINELIAHITTAVTLLPGDVVLTGTPEGVGPLEVGDTVAVAISGVGELRNRVVSEGRE